MSAVPNGRLYTLQLFCSDYGVYSIILINNKCYSVFDSVRFVITTRAGIAANVNWATQIFIIRMHETLLVSRQTVYEAHKINSKNNRNIKIMKKKNVLSSLKILMDKVMFYFYLGLLVYTTCVRYKNQ